MQITSRPPLPSSRTFDLSKVDTPLEAMLMPGADLWAGLVLGPLPGRVSVEAGDQKLTWENQQTDQGLTVKGAINGQPFQLQASSLPDAGLAYKGDTPGGAVDTLMRGGGGGFGYDGQVGEVPVSEVLALDQSPGTSGHLAYLSGTFNDVEYEAYASKGANNTILVQGHLGQDAVNQTIHQGPGGAWIIEGQIAGVSVKETIQRRH